MNIVLIGARGSGKSAIARILAQRLHMSHFVMDAEIERRVGCSIREFVEANGWDAFRDVESEVARHAGALDNTVIDTGGGVVIRHENMAALKTNGVVVWLRANPEVLAARIQGDSNRPSLTGTKSATEEIAEILDQRTPLYTQSADHTIDTDSHSPEALAEHIMELGKRGLSGDS